MVLVDILILKNVTKADKSNYINGLYAIKSGKLDFFDTLPAREGLGRG